MIRNLIGLTVLVGIEAISLLVLLAFVFTIFTWAGALGGSF